MNYREVLNYLDSQLPMFHRIGKAAYKANLDNTYALDEYFNHPHKKFKTIHIAGTNGKGSVAHFLASILQTAGYKTGLYTSPHLKDYRERIKINGIEIPENYVVSFIEKHKPYFNKIHPSFFEMTVALAFDYFASEKVDIAVIEVGLGGRLDSTNIIKPIASVITNISLDHTDLLGDTLEKIAAEKAGIIKKDVPVVIGENHKKTRHVFIQKAEEVDSPIYLADYTYSANSSYFTSDHKQSFNILKNNKICYENLKTGLLGNYQQKNIVTVIQSIEVLRSRNIKINDEDIFSGVLNVIPNTNLKGRWQIIHDRPLTICDTGHNENGMEYIVRQISDTPYKQLHFILGFVSDKNIDGILKLLPKNALYYFTKASIPRALDEKELYRQATNFGLKGEPCSSVKEAYTRAKIKALTDDLIFIGGSTFVVAEIL